VSPHEGVGNDAPVAFTEAEACAAQVLGSLLVGLEEILSVEEAGDDVNQGMRPDVAAAARHAGSIGRKLRLFRVRSRCEPGRSTFWIVTAGSSKVRTVPSSLAAIFVESRAAELDARSEMI
jgi:hypothetical protein